MAIIRYIIHLFWEGKGGKRKEFWFFIIIHLSSYTAQSLVELLLLPGKSSQITMMIFAKQGRGHIGVYDDYERWLCGIHWSGKSILEGGGGSLLLLGWLVLCGSDNLSFLLGCMFNESNAFSHILQRHGIDASRLLNAMVVVPWGRAWSGVHIKAYSCGI
jgi:hypothetical protein